MFNNAQNVNMTLIFEHFHFLYNFHSKMLPDFIILYTE